MCIIFMYKVYIYININMWNIHNINIFPLIHLFGIQQFTLSAVIFMAVQLFCKFNKNLSPLQQKLIGKIIMWPNVWWGHHILDWYCWGPDVTTRLNRAKAGSVILMLRKPYRKTSLNWTRSFLCNRSELILDPALEKYFDNFNQKISSK